MEETSSEEESNEDRRTWWKKFETPGVYLKAPGMNGSNLKKDQGLSKKSLESMRQWWSTYHGQDDKEIAKHAISKKASAEKEKTEEKAVKGKKKDTQKADKTKCEAPAKEKVTPAKGGDCQPLGKQKAADKLEVEKKPRNIERNATKTRTIQQRSQQLQSH